MVFFSDFYPSETFSSRDPITPYAYFLQDQNQFDW